MKEFYLTVLKLLTAPLFLIACGIIGPRFESDATGLAFAMAAIIGTIALGVWSGLEVFAMNWRESK